jgi:hypothetical protein
MSTITTEDGAEVSDEDFGRGNSGAPTSNALCIIPNRWADGFEASIHGHMLELADPMDRLAPSPDDLLIASIASDLAWSARTFLRAHARRLDRHREVADDRGPAESGRHHPDSRGVDTRQGGE